jgi:hypothetical protein
MLDVVEAELALSGAERAVFGQADRPVLRGELPQARAPYRRTDIGFALGLTISALVVSDFLHSRDNYCSGVLGVCRVFYVGSVAAGAGLGAWIGSTVLQSEPPGRALTVLRGAAVGALGVFVLSLPLCGEVEESNPGMVCSRDGTPALQHTAAFAAGGAVIAYLSSWKRADSGLRFTVAAGPDASASLIGRVGW